VLGLILVCSGVAWVRVWFGWGFVAHVLGIDFDSCLFHAVRSPLCFCVVWGLLLLVVCFAYVGCFILRCFGVVFVRFCLVLCCVWLLV